MCALLKSARRFPGNRWRDRREAPKDSDPAFTIPPPLWVLESKRGSGERGQEQSVGVRGGRRVGRVREGRGVGTGYALLQRAGATTENSSD